MGIKEAVNHVLQAENKYIAIDELVREYITQAYNQSDTRGKASAIFAVFRTLNNNWLAFCHKLKPKLMTEEDLHPDHNFDIDRYNDQFIRQLSMQHPELYLLCVENRVFAGHVPDYNCRARMNQAELSLKNDRQPRLALRLYNLL